MNFKKRKRNSDFRPDHEYIERSTEIYLAEDRKITSIKLDEKSYKNFISIPEPSAVDEFLGG